MIGPDMEMVYANSKATLLGPCGGLQGTLWETYGTTMGPKFGLYWNSVGAQWKPCETALCGSCLGERCGSCMCDLRGFSVRHVDALWALCGSLMGLLCWPFRVSVVRCGSFMWALSGFYWFFAFALRFFYKSLWKFYGSIIGSVRVLYGRHTGTLRGRYAM